jgi:hypothetical protein
LILNGIILDFLERDADGLEIIQRRVDPKQLPSRLKLKVIPLLTAFDYIHYALNEVEYSDPNLPYSKSHKLANSIVITLTCGLMQLATKVATKPNEPYYSSMKVVRSSLGKMRLNQQK